MWIIKSIHLINLGSHSDTYYEYLSGGVRVIQGENLDDEGQESNGSGKSLVPEAALIALIGEPSRKSRLVELIRDGEEQFSIDMELFNPMLKKSMVIKRKQSLTKHTVDIYLDGNTQREPISGTDPTTKRILEILGIAKEDLRNYFLVHKDKYKPFFDSTDTVMKEIISRFSGSDLLKGIDGLVKNDLDEQDKKIRSLQDDINIRTGKITAYKEQIKEIEDEDLDKTKKQQIEAIEKSITDYRQDIVNAGNDITKTELDIKTKEGEKTLKQQQINAFDQSITKLGTVDYKKEIQAAEGEITTFEDIKKQIEDIKEVIDDTILSLNKNLSGIKNQLAGTITCPKCAHKFSLSIKEFNYDDLIKKESEIEQEIKETKSDLKEIETEIVDTKEAISIYESEKQKYTEELRKHNKLKLDLESQKQTAQNELINIESAITRFQNLIKTKNQTITDASENEKQALIKLENKKAEKLEKQDTQPIQDKIDTCNKEILQIEQQIKKEEKEKAEIQECLTLFGRYNTYLSNQTIKSIEGYTNYYLDQFKSNLNVMIEGQKVLADGKSVREEIETTILKDGYVQGTYGRYSSGEKARLNIASILCLKKLINLNSPSGGLDLTSLDEIVESIDAKGVDSIFKALTNVNETIEIITHASNNIVGVDRVLFSKQNGVTKTIHL